MAGEWRDCEWGDIAELAYGKSLRGYKDAEGDYRVYGTNGPIGWHNQPLCMQPGVIIGRKGAYRGIHYSAEPFYVIDTAFYLKPKEDMDLRWAYYCLLTYDINGMDSGSAIPSTSRDDFYYLPVRVPPKNEQQAIACILGALDDKIELNQRMNQTLEDMARAIFKSWFVDFDPVRAKAEGREPPGLKPEIAALFPDSFEDSKLGERPIGWRVLSFTDSVDVIGGGTPKTTVSDYWGGEILWFSVVDTPAAGEVFVVSTEKTITQKGVDNSSTRILPVGTTIISARGTVGNLALVGVPMAMNQSCYGLRDHRSDKGYFLYFLAKNLVETLRQRAHGSVFNTITRDTLKSVQVVVPPDTIIEKFERIVEGVMARILSNLHETRTLSNLRDVLLPKIISGELPIQNAERIVGRMT